MFISRPIVVALATTALLTAGAAPVLAKDICLQSAGTTIVFKKAPSLKKAGAAAAVQGWYGNGVASFPFDGSAFVKTDLTVSLGASVRTNAATPARSFGAVVDVTLAGAYDFDTDSDGVLDDSSLLFAVVDCDTVTVP